MAAFVCFSFTMESLLLPSLGEMDQTCQVLGLIDASPVPCLHCVCEGKIFSPMDEGINVK